MKQTPASVVKSMGNGGNQSANTLQQNTGQGTMQQTHASVVKSMGDGGNQSANTLQQNTGQGTMQQTPASVVKSMGNGCNQSANTLPQTPALPKSGFYPNLTMGMGGGHKFHMIIMVMKTKL